MTTKKTKKTPLKLIPDLSLTTFRRQLASLDSVPQFALLGIFSGFLTGLTVLLFRLVVETVLVWFLPGDSESFEQLPALESFLLPIAGGITLAILLFLLKEQDRSIGVTHVLDRLAQHQGHLPLRNLLSQFIAGSIALITGQTGGREGPAIHLGAAASSLLGQALKLPNNSIRVLVGCGAAAAIGCSFNTPIAGVIFSMEVIIMEYTIAGFIPVILSAVTGTFTIQLVFGNDPAFFVPGVTMQSYYDLPVVVLEGVSIGILAAVLVHLIQLIARHRPSHLVTRILIAATVTASLGLIAPAILGIGYDTLELALQGKIVISMLLLIATCKLIATAANLAMGMPIGLIGPTLLIGALAGGLFWQGTQLLTDNLSDSAFYVILGMGAMMGAVLQAPLAALMAVIELTHNPGIILPTMLVIVIANITASHGFKIKSIFETQMDLLGLQYKQNPLSMALNRASVGSQMSRNFIRVAGLLSRQEAQSYALQETAWLLVEKDQETSFILRLEDLKTYLSSTQDETIDLAKIPGLRKDVTTIFLQATLSEAFDKLQSSGVQALVVVRVTAPLIETPVGILTREDIESFYSRA
ncbi:MAG: chloride channel protein [Gammaproteobacteria bacterium]|nr:chloride channel protein [Gammaproteobacteria bacterium]